jgi:hypothetical protein
MLAAVDGGFQGKDCENRTRPGRYLARWRVGDGDVRCSRRGIAPGRFLRPPSGLSAWARFIGSTVAVQNHVPRSGFGRSDRRAPPERSAKLPGPPARTLKLEKPGWRPRSVSAVGSARCAYPCPGGRGSHSSNRLPSGSVAQPNRP